VTWTEESLNLFCYSPTTPVLVTERHFVTMGRVVGEGGRERGGGASLASNLSPSRTATRWWGCNRKAPKSYLGQNEAVRVLLCQKSDTD